MKGINQYAPVKCTKKILINASKEHVWSILTAINDWPHWQKDIHAAVLKGTLTTGSTFSWKTGGAKITSTLHTVEPYRQFGWTGKTFGMFAIHNWTLKENESETEVIVDESMEGLLAGLFRKSFNKNLQTGMQKWLELLKNKCEANQPRSF
jgi:hypothetical protein